MMTKDHILAGSFGNLIDLALDLDINVVNLAARSTSDVVVGGDGCIKTFLRAADLDFQDYSAVRHEFKIPVYRAEPDARQTLPDHIVDFIGRRV